MKLEADVVDLAAVRARVEVRPAVDGQVVGVASAAVNRLTRHAEAGRERERIEVGRDGSGNERRELEIVAAVEREILDLLRVDGARHLTAGAIDRLAQGGRDFDRLVQLTDAEREVRRQTTVCRERESGSLLLAEALHLRRDRVGADAEVGERVQAGGVGHARVGESSAFIDDRHRHPRQHAAGGIGDATGNLTLDRLCDACDRQAQQQRRTQGRAPGGRIDAVTDNA